VLILAHLRYDNVLIANGLIFLVNELLEHLEHLVFKIRKPMSTLLATPKSGQGAQHAQGAQHTRRKVDHLPSLELDQDRPNTSWSRRLPCP